MKAGENPERGKQHSGVTVARIFVVVYIPHFSGWFSQMREILRICLESLSRSVDPALARITLIGNGSCMEVEQSLLARRSALFDQIVINAENRGKIDALLSVARGAMEEVVVLSDCDMLYRGGWLEDVLQTFATFPEAGSVSPGVSPRRFAYETKTTLIGALVRRELAVMGRVPVADFERMTHGKGNSDPQRRYMKAQATLLRNGTQAGIAGSHQCVAFRRELVRRLPVGPCGALLTPHADRDFLDRPIDVLGYWRVSTATHGVFHMGNTVDEWVPDVEREERVAPTAPRVLPPLRKPWSGRVPYALRRPLGALAREIIHRRLELANR